jgi:serine protease AprX
MSRGIIAALLFVLCVSAVKAQQQYAFRVSFTDKNTTTHTLTNPIAYLSQRAIDRRTTQGIGIDSTDLPVPASYIQGVLSASSGILHTKSRWFNHIVILVSNPANINAVQALPYVSSTEEVGRFFTTLHNRMTQSQPENEGVETNSLAKSSGDPNYYGPNTWPQITMVNGDYLHDQGYKGNGMLIAVLDDGFVSVPTHPGFDSLNQENRILETHNFVLDTNYIYGVSSNHGAAVLGTMAANEPGTYVGTAPYAEYALYITENLSSETPTEMYQVLAGAERADSLGADIITISSGYNTFDNPYPDLNFNDLNGSSTIAAKAANMATKKGILFVATAGNDGSVGLLTPGDADSALTVGAVQANGNAWSSSGHGPNSSGRIKPDVVTLGAPAYVSNPGGTYSYGNGTSYSTPQIAGWAACLWQAKPNATPRALRAAIDSSAHVHTAPEIQRGYGIPNFMVAAQLLNVPVVPKDMADWVAVGPNPFSEEVSIFTNLSISDDVRFRITDVSGKMLHANSQKIDSGIRSTKVALPANLAGGIYFLYVSSGNKGAVLKLVKNN